MLEVANLRVEVPSNERQIIAPRVRALDAYARQLEKFYHPFESSLVRQFPLSHEDSERLQRIESQLRSRIAKAAWDLGLQRVNTDSRQEIQSLATNMEEILHELEDVAGRSQAHGALADYLARLVTDLRRMIAEVTRVADRSMAAASGAR